MGQHGYLLLIASPDLLSHAIRCAIISRYQKTELETIPWARIPLALLTITLKITLKLFVRRFQLGTTRRNLAAFGSSAGAGPFAKGPTPTHFLFVKMVVTEIEVTVYSTVSQSCELLSLRSATIWHAPARFQGNISITWRLTIYWESRVASTRTTIVSWHPHVSNHPYPENHYD